MEKTVLSDRRVSESGSGKWFFFHEYGKRVAKIGFAGDFDGSNPNHRRIVDDWVKHGIPPRHAIQTNDDGIPDRLYRQLQAVQDLIRSYEKDRALGLFVKAIREASESGYTLSRYSHEIKHIEGLLGDLWPSMF